VNIQNRQKLSEIIKTARGTMSQWGREHRGHRGRE